MLSQLTMYPVGGSRLVELRRTLHEKGVVIAGEIRQRSDKALEFSINTDSAAAVRGLCAMLVERGLADTVFAERLDV